MTAEDFRTAPVFLEEYALRPPRAEPHNPAEDSPRWRAVQVQLRDLARRLRLAAAGDAVVEFQEADAVFLETQASRLYRMYHWIRRGRVTPESQVMGEASRVTAERLLMVAAQTRARIWGSGKPNPSDPERDGSP